MFIINLFFLRLMIDLIYVKVNFFKVFIKMFSCNLRSKKNKNFVNLY